LGKNFPKGANFQKIEASKLETTFAKFDEKPPFTAKIKITFHDRHNSSSPPPSRFRSF
jgi:hypothetical protein